MRTSIMDMDEDLIEMVRMHPEMYDKDDPRYHDNAAKNNAWMEIAEALKQKVGDCKCRWESLRSQHRKALAKKELKTKQGYTNLPKWKYENHLAFLIPFMRRRYQNGCNSDGDDSEREDSKFEIVVEETADEDVEQRTDFATTEFLYTTGELSASNSSALDVIYPKRKRRKTMEINKPSTTSSKDYSVTTGQKKGALEAFFDGIAETVKTFTPADQHIVKKKIFDIVHEFEAKYITYDPLALQHE